MDLELLISGVGKGPSPADLLADLARIADDLAVPVVDEVSERTRAAYESDFGQWESWCDLHEVPSLPLDPALVRLYVADMATQARTDGTRRYKVATIERHLAALAWHSRAAGGLHDLARHPLIAPLLAGVRLSRVERPRPTAALADADLRTVVCSMPHQSWPHGVMAARDAAVILLARDAGLRRSQAAALTVSDALALPLRPGTDPVTCPRCALSRWLRLLATTDRPSSMRLIFATGACSDREHVCAEPLTSPDPGAPLFRAVSRTGHIETTSVTDSALAQMLRRRLAHAGLDASRYGFDSLRAGARTRRR